MAELHSTSSNRLDDEPRTAELVLHDLGNLVQIAGSALRIIMRDGRFSASPASERAASHMAASLARAGNLIRLSLGNRRIDGGATVNVEDCIERLQPLLEDLCGKTIGLDVRIGILPKVRCRDLDLDNALINLALNARDAMPTGGTLSITADVAEGPEIPEVEIVVADSGHGMSREVLMRAREAFFTSRPERGGVGLGLASVARFVEQAGGRLSIQSNPGNGTSVIMRLPAGDFPIAL